MWNLLNWHSRFHIVPFSAFTVWLSHWQYFRNGCFWKYQMQLSKQCSCGFDFAWDKHGEIFNGPIWQSLAQKFWNDKWQESRLPLWSTELHCSSRIMQPAVKSAEPCLQTTILDHFCCCCSKEPSHMSLCRTPISLWMKVSALYQWT